VEILTDRAAARVFTSASIKYDYDLYVSTPPRIRSCYDGFTDTSSRESGTPNPSSAGGKTCVNVKKPRVR
jgi:hypothetical protein